ncbi:SDR family NAD(P)-dependent oxidoreductase [Flavobacterium sp. CLA17]|uniref:SDR family NAD(P)-dependent oxidoreductase n=1 Tax=Flavobacterium sp. CLA17 TaxID=2724135 RepID=UPI001490E4AC|nr:SDR family oxidoreductase [Flavobacterium sp. CLA17]QSB29230.1 SDR family oxidoreductase [Flavobacterium sp. CLA17]
MDLQLQSKTAFISGSTQGIGFAIAQQLLREGATVIINGRSEEKLAAALQKLKAELPEAAVSGIVADFLSGEQVDTLINSLPQVDILIHNVGVFELRNFTEITDEQWLSIFEVNVLSSIRLSRRLFPKMIARGWGRVVFISSESGVNIPENMIHYGMTKTALLSISNGLAKLTKNTQVTINAVLGGPTYSDGVAAAVTQIAKAQDLTEEQMKGIIIQNTNPTSLLQRFISPSEIASTVTYLCSPLASATNGAVTRVDGGVLTSL